MRATAVADIVLRRVCKCFGEIEAVHDLSLNIADGEFVVLLGPTGAGKTTTLRLVAGLEYPESGAILIDGREVTRQPPVVRDALPAPHCLRQPRLPAAVARSADA
jgi:multiple sugar transport system ATP-binding protein